jgi:hypothetical protein
VIYRRLASKRKQGSFSAYQGYFSAASGKIASIAGENLKQPRTERIGSSPLRFALPRSVTARRASDNAFNGKFQLLKASRQQGTT